MDQEQLMDFLVTTYEKVTGPLPIVGSAIDLAESYRKSDKDIHDCVDNLIHWQCSKTAASGFVSGLGGIITLPVSLPADLAQSLYVQLRMVAAIGHLYDFDVHSDRVRTLCFASLCGGSAAEILSSAGVKIGQKIAQNLIKSISRETIVAINKKVGFRLLTKFGTTGVVNLGKCIPFFGGGVGAIMNLAYTYSVGKAAKAIMGGEKVENEIPEEGPIVVSCQTDSPERGESVYGPKIHGLQLGSDKDDATGIINNLQGRHHLIKRVIEDGFIDLISEQSGETHIRIGFNEDNKINYYFLTPTIFKVKSFFSPKFLHGFEQHYSIYNLASENGNEDTLMEINENDNYSISVEDKKIIVEQLNEDDPYFA